MYAKPNQESDSEAMRRVTDVIQTVKGSSIKKLYVLKDSFENFASRYPFLVKSKTANHPKR